MHGTDGVSGRDVPVSNGQGTGGDRVEDELDSKSSSTLLETGLLCRSTMLVPSCSLFTSTNSCLESNYYYSQSTITTNVIWTFKHKSLQMCAEKSIPSKQSIPAPATKAYNSIRQSQAVNFTSAAKQSTSHPHPHYPQGIIQYPLKSKLDGPQNCSGHNGNNNKLLCLPGSNPGMSSPCDGH